jgi:hypothetical protein
MPGPSHVSEKDHLETCRSTQFRTPCEADHGAQATPDTREDDPPPGHRTRPWTARYRPAGTFSTEGCRPLQPGNRNGTPPRRPSVRQAARIRAAGNGIMVSGRRRLPAELLFTFIAVTRSYAARNPGSAFSTPSCRIAGVDYSDSYAVLCMLSLPECRRK